MIGLVILNFGAIESISNRARYGITHSNIVSQKLTYLRPIEMSRALKAINDLGVSEFEELDTRVEFLDIRKKRQEYTEWFL